MHPRYSIVVPTCDRAELLKHTLRGLLAIPRQDLQLVVSDNASVDETPNVIEAVREDPRVVSVLASQRMPMPSHWDFAFSKATGEFVIVNGDDDGISPNLFKILDTVIATHNPKIISWDVGLYHHPDYYAEAAPNSLRYLAGHSGLALTIDPGRLVEQYARLDFAFFPEGTRVCMRRDLAEEIVRKTGRLYWPPYPDFSTSLMCLLLCAPGDYVYLDMLLGFGGRSANSNGGSFVRGGRNERVHSFFNEFSDEDPYPFHEPKLPFLYNGHAAALSVAKHFFPEKVESVTQDRYFLFKSFYEELAGVRYNPLINEDIGKRLDDYLKCADRELQDVAGLAKIDATDRPRGGMHWISSLRKFMPFGKVIKKAILRSAFPEQTPVVQYMSYVLGAEHAFYNGFDLMQSFDSTVARDDPFTLKTVERALQKNLLICACRI